MNGYQADLERLTAGAGELRSLSGQAGEIAGALSKALTGFGACWGDDAAGMSFASSHEKPAGDTADAISKLATTLGDVGEKLAKTAETYRHVEVSNASALRRLDG